VLEKVRYSRDTGSFISRSDLVPDLVRDDRRRVVLENKQGQAVIERIPVDIDIHITLRPARDDQQEKGKDER